MMATEQNFYEALSSFNEFSSFTTHAHYVRPPEDWILFVTDVRDSTRAIEGGRYADVNLIGAASIAATQEAMGRESFPFVFGGDGATLLVPREKEAAVAARLLGVRQIAERSFGLDLRVGRIVLEELYGMGAELYVGKYCLPGGGSIALLRGDGIQRADALIKSEEETYLVHTRDATAPILAALTCPMDPIPASRGEVLTLLFQTRGENLEVYERFLGDLKAIVGPSLEEVNPVKVPQVSAARLEGVFRNDQALMPNVILKLFKKFASLMTFIILLLGLGNKLLSDMCTQSDYHKFDGTLRMVLDVSPEQRAQLEALCARYQDEEGTYFGLHRTTHALMTCYILGLNREQQFHFIDGGDGGYAMAARQLKSQRIA